ncbi:MAG: CotH kinase family protein [Bacteroidales bacterium]|nr:CotH kinase family protein [Bacteroidales bacterium]
MKRSILSAISGFVFLQMAFCQGFYDINTINTIEIVFEQQNWNYLLDSLYAEGEGRLQGTAFINGQQFDSVGVRYKGNSSYQPNLVKKPLNIKLDYIIPDQKVEGYGTLKLSNGFKDPSLVRETLGYEIARNYMPASQSNYAKVFINSTYLGLYTSVQDVDRYFAQTHFLCNDKTRIKGEINGNMLGINGVWNYLGSDSSLYFDRYTLESEFGWTELVQFFDTVNHYNNYLKSVLNIDRHLWMLAYDNLLVNLDAPINMPQNFYMLKDLAGRFNPILWDLNETFGVFVNAGPGPPLNSYQLQHFDPFYRLNDPDYPIVSKVLNNPVHKRMYVAHMKTMVEELFENGWYEQRALEIQDIIDEEVQNDPNKLYTYQEFLSNIYNSTGGGPPPQPPPIIGIVQLMDTRVDFLYSLQPFQLAAPEISDISYSPMVVAPGEEVWITTTVDDAVAVQLGFRMKNHGSFSRINMYDDGNHHDGAAGDGVYGVSLVAGPNDIEYYIFADNDEAVAFSPPRAEYGFYTIHVDGDVVINEFMADNETTVTDQDGEYDDWIELYNNNEYPAVINGWYLSDDAGNPGKWPFPDTTIAPGDYLIVWADEDGSQEGLHANFKISANGEMILLSDAGLNLIDEISFGPQKPDTTTGRFPNGTGDFIEMIPTFGEENINLLVSTDPVFTVIKNQPVLRQNYPNPFLDYTTLSLVLPEPQEVSLEIYDLWNRKTETVFTGCLERGEHDYLLNGSYYPPGIYFATLITDHSFQQIKMLKTD